ncbi:porin family protein [Legionella israelensis]|uniref:outer membrane protein n=1 Tax=Legionella israelensis TaxID=454 RepID=UPI00117F5412|nr:outer membrane beta-barrel protein [Legionella israelensis]QDP72080.1 porin family protein [Legionella israelensis]
MRASLFSAALLATGISIAATPVDGWYSSVFGGYTYLPDNVSDTTFGILRDGTSYQNGFNAGVRFGFKSNPLRYEGEYTYLHADLKHFNVNNIRQFGSEGSSSASLLMANIYYDFPEIVPCVEPFLGVGLGYAHVKAILKGVGQLGFTHFKASDNVFAYQATAGLTYNFAENYAVNVAYRFAATEQADTLGKVFQAHIASVGVIYRFDESSYK